MFYRKAFDTVEKYLGSSPSQLALRLALSTPSARSRDDPQISNAGREWLVD